MAWPTTSDVEAAVAAFGASVPAGFDTAGALAVAIETVERVTGWSPIEPDASDVEVFVDPTFGVSVPLPCGFVSITSVEVDGVTLTANEDYCLEPTGAPTRNQPYSWLRMARTDYSAAMSLRTSPGAPGTIKVTGKRGYAAAIPQAFANAAVMLAASEAIKASQGVNGPITELQQGLLKVKYGGSGGGNDASSDMERKAMASLAQYVRMF